MVYLFVKDGNVEHYADKEEAQRLFGYGEPDLEITEKQYDEAEGLFRIINGKIFLGKTKEEKKEDLATEKRSTRDGYLLETDKYMISDFPISENKKDEMKKYRQTLRDLPENKNFPDIEVPSIPVL